MFFSFRRLFSQYRFFLIPLLAYCIYFGFYLFAHGPEFVVQADQTAKYKKALDYIETGSFEYSYENADFDPEYQYAPYSWPLVYEADSKQYIVYPETFVFILIPFILLWGKAGLAVYTFLLSITCILIFGLAIDRLVKSARLKHLALITFTFGSTFFSYFLEAGEYNIIALSTSLAIFNLTFHNQKSISALILAFITGIVLGVAFSLRQETGIFSLLYLTTWLYFLNAGKLNSRFLITAITAAFIALAYFIFNFIEFGSVFGLRFDSVSEEETSLQQRFKTIIALLFLNPAGFGIGMFARLPILLLLFYRLIHFFRKASNLEKSLLVTYFCGMFLVALLSPNDGWGGFGSRYLLAWEIMGLLLVFMRIEVLKSGKLKSLILGTLFFVVFALSLIGAYLRHHILMNNAALRDMVESASSNYIGSNFNINYWIGNYEHDHHIFHIRDAATGNREFVELMNNANVNSFCWVSTRHDTDMEQIFDQSEQMAYRMEHTDQSDDVDHVEIRCFRKATE